MRRLLDKEQDPAYRHTESEHSRYIENKGYLALLVQSQQTVKATWPGRHLLIDIGTGRYNSGSLPWFTQWYAHRGINFMEIWAWEADQLNAGEYWSEVPSHVAAKLRFYNLPATSRRDDPLNPLNMLREWWRPGDFVSIKLDIDLDELEEQLLEQIDDELIGMIGELFWEPHHNAGPMHPFFGNPDKPTIPGPKAIRKLAALRAVGLRIHYWP